MLYRLLLLFGKKNTFSHYPGTICIRVRREREREAAAFQEENRAAMLFMRLLLICGKTKKTQKAHPKKDMFPTVNRACNAKHTNTRWHAFAQCHTMSWRRESCSGREREREREPFPVSSSFLHIILFLILNLETTVCVCKGRGRHGAPLNVNVK